MEVLFIFLYEKKCGIQSTQRLDEIFGALSLSVLLPYIVQMGMAISFILSESINDQKKAITQLYDQLPDSIIVLEECTSDILNDTQSDLDPITFKIEYSNKQAERLFSKKIDDTFITSKHFTHKERTNLSLSDLFSTETSPLTVTYRQDKTLSFRHFKENVNGTNLIFMIVSDMSD
jgi:hypothetical protein